MKTALLLLVPFLAGCYPALKTPESLAKWSGCRPDYIADWIGAMTDYRKIPQWEPARIVMERGTADCKGRATIALETLLICDTPARIVFLKNGGRYHAVTAFVMANGKGGLIDSGNLVLGESGADWGGLVRELEAGWSIVGGGGFVSVVDGETAAGVDSKTAAGVDK